ncbi:MAG: hypothetical protein FWF60_04130 [Oscillospiraceae bacterium]|nr:hypothetical protein [Oscillospiraceae bacterium]
MKHAKKLLAVLLALALVLALAVPAFAAGEGGFAGRLKALWERIKAAFHRLLVWLGIIDDDWCDVILPPDEPYDPDFPPAPKKPVIYLYPERPMEISVTVRPRDARFTETIPAYGEGWRVLAQPGGTLTDLSGGGEYPYLFWEAALEAPWPRLTEGFVVAREDLARFLGEKLRFLGLNEAEAGEFLAYWLPRLAGNEYTLVHFAGAYYDGRFPLGISPAPDSLLRVFLVAKAATGDERIAPQELVPFERKGFTVIEWGGMIV